MGSCNFVVFEKFKRQIALEITLLPIFISEFSFSVEVE